MKQIHKYPIQVATAQVVQMPYGAKIITAQMQNERLCLWAIVDPKAPQVARHILIYGTGEPMAHGFVDYIATVQEGGYVWHVFEQQA